MKAFVINLNRRPDRMEAVSKTLAELGIDFERVSAFDARSDDLWQHVDWVKARIYVDFRTLVPGSIGAYLSHRKIWSEIVAKSLPQALIFEDDVIAVDFDHALLNFDLSATGIDLLRIEEMQIPYATKMRTESFSVNFLGRQAVGIQTYGLAAYVVTLAGAKKLLKAEKYWFNCDHFDIWERVYGLKTAVLRPPMFAQAVSTSDSRDFNQYPGYIHHILANFLTRRQPSLVETFGHLKWWLVNALLDVVSFLPRRLMLHYSSLFRAN